MPSSHAPRHTRRTSHPQSSVSSPASSPVEASSRRSSVVAFVQVDPETAGVSHEARRAVRVQAAKSSAAARKKTIARKLASKRGDGDVGAAAAAAAAAETVGGATVNIDNYDDTKLLITAPDHLRRFSLPSSLLIAHETAVSSPASVNSSPTLSIRHTDATTWAFPTPLRHPELPTVVDYFLTHFAPARTASGDTQGREKVREQLWWQALGNPSLFHACLLIAGSHAYATSAFHVPMDLLSQAKHIAIMGVNAAVSRSLPDEQVEEAIIAAIALLGGWELEYGDPAVYDTHMRGLQTIVQLRGGLTADCSRNGHQSRIKALSGTTVKVILSVAHSLALYASRQPYFENPECHIPALPDPPPDVLPDGLQELRAQQLCHGSLLLLVAMLQDLATAHPATATRVTAIHEGLLAWDCFRAQATQFCPLQTDFEDNLNRTVHVLIRQAGLALCACFGHILHLPVPISPQSLYGEILQLKLETLVGTVYAHVAFWALFTICAAAVRGEPRHIRMLRRLQLDLDIKTWDAVQARLARYAYPSAVLDARAYALWEAVLSSSATAAATDRSFELIEPTRYAQGTSHPTLQIGAAIAASELEQRIHLPAFLAEDHAHNHDRPHDYQYI